MKRPRQAAATAGGGGGDGVEQNPRGGAHRMRAKRRESTKATSAPVESFIVSLWKRGGHCSESTENDLYLVAPWPRTTKLPVMPKWKSTAFLPLSSSHLRGQRRL